VRRYLPAAGVRRRVAGALPQLVAGRTFDAMARQVARDLVKADADAEPWRPLEERLGVPGLLVAPRHTGDTERARVA
jgi:hypothetical protein